MRGPREGHKATHPLTHYSPSLTPCTNPLMCPRLSFLACRFSHHLTWKAVTFNSSSSLPSRVNQSAEQLPWGFQRSLLCISPITGPLAQGLLGPLWSTLHLPGVTFQNHRSDLCLVTQDPCAMQGLMTLQELLSGLPDTPSTNRTRPPNRNSAMRLGLSYLAG